MYFWILFAVSLVHLAAGQGCRHDPPDNGAIVCAANRDGFALNGGFCIPMCRKGFDFASRPGKCYVCFSFQLLKKSAWHAVHQDDYTSGGWPDCVRMSDPSKPTLMPANYYFTGDLLSEVDKRSSKTRAIEILKAIQFPGQLYNCNTDPKCSVGNFVVIN